MATTVAKKVTEACGKRPRGKAIPDAIGKAGASLADARNLLSCSKADAFYMLKKEGNRLASKRLPDFVMA